MPRFCSRRRFLLAGLAAWVGAGSSGCGTLLYPERIGQPPGPLDWRVVALDTIGLLFFFIPGVIAFVVDFWNGTIYLPPRYGAATLRRDELVAVQVPREELTEERIAEVVSREIERPVRLEQGRYETREIRELDEFWATHAAMSERHG